MIETNIDDASPEISAHVMAKLFEIGALDVFFTPIFMKKNRPATLLSVISPIEIRDDLIRTILIETSTFGVRYYETERKKLTRDLIQIETEFGSVRAKHGWIGGELIKIVPEFEDCKKIAIEQNRPIREIFEAVIRAQKS